MNKSRTAMLLVAMLICLPTVVLASSPKFTNVSEVINNDGSLTVTFSATGLGNNTTPVSLTANGEAVWGCINNGDKHPKASNKTSGGFSVNASGNITPDHNGNGTGSLTGPVPSQPAGFSCPSGQTAKLLSVKYTDIVLSATATNGTVITKNLPNISRTFFP